MPRNNMVSSSISSESRFASQRVELQAGRVAPPHAQSELLWQRCCPELFQPRERFSFALTRFGVRIENAPAANRRHGCRLTKNEAITGNKYDRLCKVEARETG